MSEPTKVETSVSTPEPKVTLDPVIPANPDQPSNEIPASTDKPSDAALPADTNPPVVAEDTEEYELEIGEESPLTEEDLNEIVEEASRLRLSKEDASKLINAREKAYKTGADKVRADYQSKIDAQRKEIMSDEMFRDADTSKKTFESMTRAIETFGDEDMVNLVQTAEFGNNVVLARFLKRLGDAMAPDTSSMTAGKGSSGAAQEEGNGALKQLYPEFFTDKK